MKLYIQAVSDTGCVRDHNEDMALIGHERLRDGRLTLTVDAAGDTVLPLAVSDGMGGCAAGEVASEMVIDALDDFADDLSARLTVDELSECLRRWAETTNRLVVMRGEAADTRGMGTTLCGVMFYCGHIIMYNAGDSRVYRLRNGILRKLTTDHSMRELTGRDDFPSSAMYNCFGLECDFFIDIKDITANILDDDVLIICSDGLNDMLSDEEIESLSPDAFVMADAARMAGGKDNVTIVLIKIGEKP